MANHNNLPTRDANDIRGQFEDERTQARIREHLENEDDVITEQDIANIQVGAATPIDSVVNAAADAAIAAEQKKDEEDDSSDPEIETPWNILQP